VLQVVEAKQLEVTTKDITDPAVADELIEHGGKRQVPYLIDSERGTAMYESGDIIAYLVSRISGDAGVQESTTSDESVSSDESDGGE
jgi:glutathione S-transferase